MSKIQKLLRYTSPFFLLIALIFLIDLLYVNYQWDHSDKNFNDFPQYVAHALGSGSTETFKNSLEALNQSYAKGCRLFEIDLWLTSDKQVVAFHDGNEKTLGLSPGFSYKEFMAATRFTPVDLERLTDEILSKKNIHFISDTKSEIAQTLSLLCLYFSQKGLRCQDFIIPQIYNIDSDLETVKKLGFKKVFLTLYRMKYEQSAIDAYVKDNPEIAAVVTTPGRLTKRRSLSLARMGRPIYVHTLNDPDEITQARNHGAWGIYSDVFCK